jgi:hypothetical protein
MAMVQLLLDQHPGPLPISGKFQCMSSETVDVIVTGVAYRKQGAPNGPAIVEIVIRKDGKEVGKASGVVEGSAPGGWRAMVSQWGQMKLEAGETYEFVVQPALPEVASSEKHHYTATIVY